MSGRISEEYFQHKIIKWKGFDSHDKKDEYSKPPSKPIGIWTLYKNVNYFFATGNIKTPNTSNPFSRKEVFSPYFLNNIFSLSNPFVVWEGQARSMKEEHKIYIDESLRLGNKNKKV